MNMKQFLHYLLGTLLTIFVFTLLFYFVVHKQTGKISDLTKNTILGTSQNNNGVNNISNTDLSVNKYQNIQDYFNKNDFNNANKELDTQLSSDPNNIQLLLLKATTLAQQGSLQFKEKEYGDKARVVVDQILKLDPKNVQAWTLLGYTYEIQQNYDEAHKAYDKALILDPNSVDTLAQKGHAYDLQGKGKEAEVFYKRVLEIDSKNTEAVLGFAKILANRGDISKATEKP